MDRAVLPLKVYRTFYNSFYAIRLQVRLRGQPVELIFGRTNPQISCKDFPATSFVPVLQELFHLFSKHGVTNFGRCWSDPLPIVEVEFEDLDYSVRSLLESIDETEPKAWRIFYDAFKKECSSAGKLDKVKTRENGLSRSRSGSPLRAVECSIEILFFSPNHYRREVDIMRVTLANYTHVEKQMEKSLVFDFASAIQQYQKQGPLSSAVKEHIDTDVLHKDLAGLTNWFHFGLLLKVPETQLLAILFSCKYTSRCRVQLIEQWVQRERVRQTNQQLTKLVAAILAAGRKSIATHLVKKYGILMNSDVIHQADTTPTMELLLADPDVDDMKEDLEETDHQLVEKQKTLEQYDKERVLLKLSCTSLKKSFCQTFQEINSKISEINRMEEERDTIQNEMASLKVFCEMLESEVNSIESELEGASYFTIRTIGARVQQRKTELKNVQVMTIRRNNRLCELTEELKSTKDALLVAKKRIVQLNEEWLQESGQVMSKSQQIHQLKRVMDQMRGRVMMKAARIDQLLQQKMAARNKPQPPVFQLQYSVTKETIESRQQEVHHLQKQEETVSSEITATQFTILEKEKENNQLLMKIKQEIGLEANKKPHIQQQKENKEEEQVDDDGDGESRIVQFLELVEQLVDLKEKLLNAKEQKWELERQAATAMSECAQLREKLSEMEAEIGDAGPRANGTAVEEQESSMLECVITPGEVAEIEIGHPIQFTIPLDDKSKFNPRKHVFTAELRASCDSSVITMSMGYKATKPPTLTAICQPTIRGRHQLHIKANNKALKGSPFAIFVKYHPILITGKPVKVINGFSYPYGITTTSSSSHLIVSDCRKQQVVMMEKETQKRIMTISSQALNSKIKLPNGVTVDKAGNIYVSDSGSHCIHKFSPEGTHIVSVGSKGENLLQFGFPYGIKFAPDNQTLLICDHNNFRIQVLSPDLKFKQSIYTGSPYDITIDGSGVLYITDRCTHTIHVHDIARNSHVRTIASRGSDQGQLLEPRGICINQEGFIFVVEETNCRVSVFEKEGHFVTSFGREGKDVGEFNTPQGIAVDDDGFVYVCDMLNHRLQVF